MIDCPHWSDCGVRSGGCCAIGKYGGRPSFGVCRKCLGLPEAEPPPAALSRSAWPLLARAVATLAFPGDVGLGDVVARLVGAAGGETLADWYERITGRECGCKSRRESLNRLYPLHPPVGE